MDQKIQTPPPQSLPPMANQSGSSKKSLVMILILLAVVLIGGGAGYYFLYYEKNEPTDNVSITVDQNVNEKTNTNELLIESNTNSASSVNDLNNSNNNLANLSSDNTNIDLDELTSSTFNTNTDAATNQNVNALATTNTNTAVVMDLNTNTTSANINSGSTWSLGISKDTDNDKVPDNIEIWYGTDRNESDTDGDGYDDYIEIAGCYNPIGNGRIDSYDFIDYCFESLRGMGIEQNGNPPFRLTEYCNEWTMEAETLINEAVDGGDVNQVWTDMYLAGFDSRCEEMNDIDYGELTIDPDRLCSMAQKMLAGFCNTTHW